MPTPAVRFRSAGGSVANADDLTAQGRNDRKTRTQTNRSETMANTGTSGQQPADNQATNQATIQDVAREVGVSVSTVSRSFTRPNLVNENTRERVLAAARRLGFSISRSAMALKSGRSFRVALLLPSPVTEWFNISVYAGLLKVLAPAGYDLSVFVISDNHARRQFFADMPLRRNADAVAHWLEKHPKVEFVRYPTLEGDPYHAAAQKYLPEGCSGVISFSLKGGREAGARFIDSLKMASLLVHVADIRTCVLHPASSTHRQLSDEQLIAAGITPGMVRLSVGLENLNDIIADLKQALEQA